MILVAGDFARFCDESLRAFSRRRVIVIGPEPVGEYERAAMSAGAGVWLPLERVGEDLEAAIGSVLGCLHAPTRSLPPEQ